MKDANIIRTRSGLHSTLRLWYDFGSVIDWKERPQIDFNPATKTISLPLVAANGKVTHQTILYRFNGQYFEKVKG